MLKTKKIFCSNLMSEISKHENLNRALESVYKKRRKDSHNSDIWELSLNWEKHRDVIRQDLLSNKINLSPVDIYRSEDGEYYTRWSSKDALVIKAITYLIEEIVQSTCHKNAII